MGTVRMRGVVLVLGSLIGAILLAPGGAAAETLVANVSSKPCAGSAAQTWRIGYRLYFRDSAGRNTDAAATPGVIEEAQGFADAVATDSACALRASVDIYDMGAEPWAGTAAALDFSPPSDNGAFRARNGYDATFIRYPKQGVEQFSGIAGTERVYDADGNLTAIYPVSAFPVDAAGRSYPNDPPQDPWRLLLMHEWMHQIVFFYVPAELGWPSNDVHGAVEHGYAQDGFSAGVIEPYFADMLQGRVLENGQPRGLLPEDYRREGTPAHPKRKFLALVLKSDIARRLSLTAPPDFDGVLTVTVRNGWELPNEGPVRRRGRIAAGSTTWKLDDRGLPPRITICAQSPATGSTSYRPDTECFRPWVPRCVVPSLAGLTVAQAKRKLMISRCRLGRVRHDQSAGHGKRRVRSQGIRPGRHLSPRSRISVTTDSGRRS